MASIASGEAQQGKKVITCFCGDAFVDVQTSAMSRLPIWGHDTRVDSVKILAGGSLCNVARRFGALVDSYPTSGFVTEGIAFEKPVVQCVTGKDTLGQIQCNTLRDEGFTDVSNVLVDDVSSQATCIVMTGASDRAFVSCNSTNSKLSPKYMYKVACKTFDNSNYFGSIYHLHIGGYFCCAQMMTKDLDIHLKMLKEKYTSVTISLDTNFDATGQWTGNGFLQSVLPYVDIMFPNEMEAQGISKQDTPGKALETLCSMYPNCLFVMTVGKDGAKIGKGSSLRLDVSPGALVDHVVDSTGAGDSFAAAFLFQYLVESKLLTASNEHYRAVVQRCCQVANIAGGLCVQQHGAVSEHYSYADLRSCQAAQYGGSA